MFFAEYFLPLKKSGYLRQIEYNLEIKSVFLSALQGSVITEFFPDAMKTVKLKYFRIFKMFPMC